MEHDRLKDADDRFTAAEKQKVRDAETMPRPLPFGCVIFAAKFLWLIAVHEKMASWDSAGLMVLASVFAGIIVGAIGVPLFRWTLKISWGASARLIGAFLIGTFLARIAYMLLYMR